MQKYEEIPTGASTFSWHITCILMLECTNEHVWIKENFVLHNLHSISHKLCLVLFLQVYHMQYQISLSTNEAKLTYLKVQKLRQSCTYSCTYC